MSIEYYGKTQAADRVRPTCKVIELGTKINIMCCLIGY